MAPRTRANDKSGRDELRGDMEDDSSKKLQLNPLTIRVTS